MSPDVAALMEALERLRSSFLKKIAGLDDSTARHSTVRSGTSLGGLLQHLTYVESYWFEEVAGGGRATRGLLSMRLDPEVSLRTLRAEYKAACETSRAIIEGIGDGDAPVDRAGTASNLRQVIIHVITETARHAGHADIIREQIDGKTGR